MAAKPRQKVQARLLKVQAALPSALDAPVSHSGGLAFVLAAVFAYFVRAGNHIGHVVQQLIREPQVHARLIQSLGVRVVGAAQQPPHLAAEAYSAPLLSR